MKVAIFANCHGHVVSDLIKRVSALRGSQDIVCTPFLKYETLAQHQLDELHACDMLIDQVGDPDAIDERIVGFRGRVIKMPPLSARVFYPFSGKEYPGNDATKRPWRSQGIYTLDMTDWQLVQIAQKRGLGPDSDLSAINAAIDEYLALDYAKLINLDRVFELYRTQVRRVEAIDGFDVWRHFEAQFRARQICWDYGHPSNYLIKAIAQEILRILDAPTEPAEIELACNLVWEDDEAFKFAAPMHPSVARHFCITWADEKTRYRRRYDENLTIEEFARAMLRLECEEPRYELLLSWVGHDLKEEADRLVAELDQAATNGRESAPFRLRCGQLCQMAYRLEEAARHYSTGLRLEPGHAGLARRLLQIMDRTAFSAPAPVLEPSSTLSFCRGEAGAAGLKEGWWEAEPGGVWSAKHECTLALALRRTDASVRSLKFDLGAKLDRLGSQRVRVFVEGRELAIWVFDLQSRRGNRRIELPSSYCDKTSLTIRFYIEQPVSERDLQPPGEAPSSDWRPVGLFLRSVELETDRGTYCRGARLD
jgi:hypothetical protein